MDSFIDREFQQVYPIQERRWARDFFGRMLVISLVMHAILSVILLSTRHATLKGPPVNYMELKDLILPDKSDYIAKQKAKSAEVIPEEPDETQPPAAETHSAAEQLQQNVKQSLADAEENPDLLHEKSFSLGLTSGYFSSLAEGETLRDDIRDYYFSMLREINEKWWLNNKGNFGNVRGAIVEIVVGRNGMIVNKTLVRSSGNPSFDQAIFTTLEKANPLPPLPDNYQLPYFSAPLRFVAPLNFFTS
ncbi:MAG: cell envelope integrity protein TolA [Geobacteraceae bacterium]